MEPTSKRGQRWEWLLILLIIATVAIISRFELQLFELARRIPLSSNILVLALVNINLLLIALFLFLILRNVFKLILERRRQIPGTRLRTKLVIAFIGLSLIPTMLLFFVSAGFITTSIQNWFSTQIETSLGESLEVAQTYYQNSATNALFYADQLARTIKDEKLLNQNNLPKLKELIKNKQQEYNLGVVEVFSSTREELVRATNPNIPESDYSNPNSVNIDDGFKGKRFTDVTPIGKADLIRGIVPVYSNWNPDDIVAVVAVNYYVPYSLVNKMKEISNSFEQYKNTKAIKVRIQKIYIIVLLLIALIIIFLATWFGFHLARSITGPIQELAEATIRVAGGDLNVSIAPQSKDEVGLLVAAFNTMTGDLRQGRERLQAANQDLLASNTELDQRRRYMEIVLKNVTAGVISLDRQGCLTTVNHSAERLLRIPAGSAIGQPLRDMIGAEQMPVIREFLNELYSSGKDSLRKQLLLTIQDSKLTLQVTVTNLRDESGEIMGTVVVFDDLSDLMKAQRMAAWREVARRIAHEIKNPLTPIKLSAQRLRKRYLGNFPPEDRVFDECTRMIEKQVDELKTLVDEFSSFARMPASNPTPNNLNDLIAEALVLYQEGHRSIQFAFRPDPHIPALHLDREQIKRVIVNLLDNSVAAVDAEPVIEIESSYNPELGIVQFSVADNGCGISAEDKPRLFEPYFSTKKTGTGLGLSIVSTIITDHNGYIRVKDNSPKGTRFIIELPAGDRTT
ncbi:MAG: PAS domain-containing sensor histidine kinase [Desulfuromonadales bacterium GWC2_61_20]|nr:MAG: PAS domain-containing sensor histidine kinase [Desulfuromonadales bacterium GWC2_61_20]